MLGLENALRLTLNIEQYEYMPGPHDAAGIKMLLHDRDEIPRVHALGQAIPPGSHVFVGVKIVEVKLESKLTVTKTCISLKCSVKHSIVVCSVILDRPGHVNS